ncbi:cation-translocating P-type ATPase [Polymorphum gilvum]|uniref:Cation-transporting ATPase, calcium-transporting ATPase n=1 Tax=Polymorphum gilvum (strain LMG 25793 / CGMCC 1.9160 / SL003B-26A1) TaxID=991905 RepID=F2J4B1_POLGS|nr:HAD-IC family P-type ATPase [Polymorphum gilvum]ADZ71053.1 Cation-transporting ATPase, calcium-transporting ATPase [Polymorphum gilvum SL003B-26A1]
MHTATRPVTPPEDSHGLTADEVLARLSVDARTGLDDAEVEARLARFGPNQLERRATIGVLALLAHQVSSPVVYLLATAAALALAFGEWNEGIAILVVLALNGLIGFLTERKAARSIEALRALGTQSARVRRAGHVRMVPAEQLVPGDIVLVEGGDGISADLRLIEAANLAADESTLTGESVPVDKGHEPVAAGARLGDRASMLFKGTSVTQGSGLGVVVGTGVDTELGRIALLVAEASPERTPLERDLARLSGQLVWATLALTAVIAGIGLAKGEDALLMVEAAIALAVAAIPEGLPVVATLTLARGMWRMARQNALIERLPAVETLGATTVILTDKTGTLTENRMTVRRIWIPSGEIDLAYEGAHPGTRAEALRDEPQLRRLLEVAVLCNNASLGADDGTGRDQDSGDPMELALLRAGRKADLRRATLLAERPELREHAFDTATRMMATVHREADGCLYAVKGAPEAVLERCVRREGDTGDVAFGDDERADWLRRVDQFGQRGLRVLAIACRRAPDPEQDPYRDLTFLGLVGLEDPARVDVPEAIAACRQAGIKVVMVTGDHAVTARSIGRMVGLEENGIGAIEGPDLADLHARQDASLLQAGIFARVSPAEKLGLVRAYQKAGAVVAMTGDGVNDAPALRQADIGIAMGLRGTDVAREAAAMVLLDDAFPSIVKAIREGRIIFGNIRRFAAYLLSCNLSEVLVVGLAILFALPLPLLPLQILYLNLVTDVFPAFALAMGEGERNVMARPPRPPGEPILGPLQWSGIVAHGVALTAGTLAALLAAEAWLELDGDALVTVSFLTLAFAQLWHVFAMRHHTSAVLRNEVTGNPWVWAALALCTGLLAVPPHVPALAEVMQLVPPDRSMWLLILVFSAAPLLVNHAVSAVLIRIAAPR